MVLIRFQGSDVCDIYVIPYHIIIYPLISVIIVIVPPHPLFKRESLARVAECSLHLDGSKDMYVYRPMYT